MIATIGRFFVCRQLQFFFERQAEPAPNSRRAEPGANSRTRLLQIEAQRSRADRLPPAALGGRLSLHPIHGVMMPRPIHVSA